MEKTINFSILKEKIIKTDELLAVLLEKNRSLEKSQKFNQHLKTQLELAKNEIRKLKLRNETLIGNLTSNEKTYNSLRDEHNQLKEKFVQLENESGNTINNLQVNYQLANRELLEYQQKLSILEAKEIVSDEVPATKRRKQTVEKRKSPIKKKNEDQDDIFGMRKKITDLQTEKEKLISEKTDLKLEVYELKKRISAMKFIENENNDYLKIKEELDQVKNNFDVSIERKDKEIEKLSREIKIVEKQRDELLSKNLSLPEIMEDQQNSEKISLEATNQAKNQEIERLSKEIKNVEQKRDELLVENKKLKSKNNEIETRKEEIQKLSKLVESLKLEKMNLQIENESLKIENSFLPELESSNQNSEESDKKIKKLHSTVKIKNEEIKRLSETIKSTELEKNNLQSENERLKNKKCSCHFEQENFSQNTEEIDVLQVEQQNEHCHKNTPSPIDEEIEAIMKEMDIPSRISPFRSPTVEDYQEHTNPDNESQVDNVRRESNEEPFSNNSNLEKIINKRRKLKKRQLIAKKKRRKLDLYGTLLALKRAKINFIISSDSLLSANQNATQFKNVYPKNIKIRHKPKPMTITKELSCSLSCCKNSYMILKNEGEDAPLLGFVGVKNEINKQKESEYLFTHKDLQVYKKRKITKSCKEVCENVTQKYKNCSNNDEVEETEVENDEGYQSYQSESASSSPRSCNSIERSNEFKVSRSKTKRNSVLSVIKKRKVSTTTNLAITKSVDLRNSVREELSENSENNSKNEEFIFKKPASIPKSPKATFKRPVCSTRRSQRLLSKEHHEVNSEPEKNEDEEKIEETPLETPKSPTPESEPNIRDKPVVIPLEKVTEKIEKATEKMEQLPEKMEKMPTSKIEMLFNKLILYSKEEEALNEVIREFTFQEPDYIAEAILERVSLDYHERADTKYSPAPLMTDVQRTMLGFMSKLEKSNVIGVFDSYLTLSEQKLLTCNSLQEFEPITRLYLAACKLKKNLTRMRKLCCDVFYFCGDLAVPFFFTVLTSWTEVLPHEADSKDFPIARVLVQIVYMKECNKPGYNFMPLRDLLIKFYGYPTERWDYNEFFKELLDRYLSNPSRSSDFALLLYCKNRSEKWVYEQIEQHLKPLINLKIQDNFKATLVILIGNLFNRFSSKSEVNYLPKIREWLTSLVNEETADVVKRCVYLSLSRLKKK